MTKFEKTVNIICRYSAGLCAFLLVGWVFLFAAYIVARLLGAVWIFVEECTGYLLVFLAYIPLAYALMSDTHVKMDAISGRLGKTTKCIWKICTDILALLLASYLVGRSIELVIHTFGYGTRSGSILNLLMWPVYLIIPVGLALLALALTTKVIHSVLELKSLTRPSGSRDRVIY
jgi:TRAP-type C4-dicarboxylate transport system permease small subunit